jgi:hypothetical protein
MTPDDLFAAPDDGPRPWTEELREVELLAGSRLSRAAASDGPGRATVRRKEAVDRDGRLHALTVVELDGAPVGFVGPAWSGGFSGRAAQVTHPGLHRELLAHLARAGRPSASASAPASPGAPAV